MRGSFREIIGARHGMTAYQTALISIKTTGDTDCGQGDGIDKRSDLDH